jgi:hypothetical protein
MHKVLQQRKKKMKQVDKRLERISMEETELTPARKLLKTTKHFIVQNLRAIFPSPREFDYGIETPKSLVKKWRNIPWDEGPYPKSLWEAVWLSVGAFIGLAIIGIISEYGFRHVFNEYDGIFYAAYGAASVILFGNQNVNVAQMKNFFWGNVISTVTALTVHAIFQNHVMFVAGSLSVSFSIFLMAITETLNPPSGALALLFVVSSDFQKVGWWYILTSLLGTAILIAVALFFCNWFRFYQYPTYWRFI